MLRDCPTTTPQDCKLIWDQMQPSVDGQKKPAMSNHARTMAYANHTTQLSWDDLVAASIKDSSTSSMPSLHSRHGLSDDESTDSEPRLFTTPFVLGNDESDSPSCVIEFDFDSSDSNGCPDLAENPDHLSSDSDSDASSSSSMPLLIKYQSDDDSSNSSIKDGIMMERGLAPPSWESPVHNLMEIHQDTST